MQKEKSVFPNTDLSASVATKDNTKTMSNTPSNGLGIVKFLEGKNCLVTGSTGFLGKGTILYYIVFHKEN